SRVIVGVSGGADSLALLHALWQLRSDLNCELHVATLDHGLRGDAGAADALFVKEFARSLHLPCTLHTVDTREQAIIHGVGVESAARKVRYDFLANVAQEQSAPYIAVAHHANDQAETILMHIIRGSGLAGLRGMEFLSTVPGHEQLNLIRPLLNVTRNDIDAYCREHHLHPRQDMTNFDTAYLRNTLRHEIIPALRQINPQIDRALNQLSDIVAVQQDHLAAEYEHVVRPHLELQSQRVLIDKQVFNTWHPALQREALRRSILQVFANMNDLAYNHIINAINIAKYNQVGAQALFPDGIRMRVDYTTLIIEPDDLPLPKPDEILMHLENPLEIEMAVATDLPRERYQIAIQRGVDETAKAHLAIPDNVEIVLRNRLPGDRFKPRGMRG
ncbi:MAG: tRNA lysidine(34) synthetase TilS, partial [Anaerolineae bacterium]|nr:tRNA lysidine(34) synthetase TilS [Anaerolineae bacterium]